MKLPGVNFKGQFLVATFKRLVMLERSPYTKEILYF